MKGGRGTEPSPNPWIDKRHFDVVQQRCVEAEDLCKRLIDYIARDDGTFRAEYTDHVEAAKAILEG